MEAEEMWYFFQSIGEIWRDKTGRVYWKYPKAFSRLSFKMVCEKFNKRFPDITIPEEIIQLRDAMAHGIIANIDQNETLLLVKFRESGVPTELKVEFNLFLEPNKVTQIRQSLKEIRRHVSKKINSDNAN